MIRYIAAASLMMAYLSGCGGQQSPLPRLELEAPVDVKKFAVSECQLYGEPIPDSDQMAVNRGDLIEITGILSSGNLNTKSLSGGWKYESGEPRRVEQGRLLSEQSIALVAFVHGSNPTKKLGIVVEEVVETRRRNEESLDYEFRVRIKAPNKPGTYVFDLQAIDESLSLQRGQKITKPLGTPVWRRELLVQ